MPPGGVHKGMGERGRTAGWANGTRSRIGFRNAASAAAIPAAVHHQPQVVALHTLGRLAVSRARHVYLDNAQAEAAVSR